LGKRSGGRSGMFALAPSVVKIRTRLSLRRHGKRDAKAYSQSLDTTLTHSLIYVQSIAQAGQHKVNEEFLREMALQVSALAALKEAHTSLVERIVEKRASQKALKGRALDREEAIESELQRKKRDVQSQAATNLQRIELAHLQAQQALDSWVTYYQTLASIYIRYRLRIKGFAAPSDAEVPQFQSLPLADVEIELSKVKIS